MRAAVVASLTLLGAVTAAVAAESDKDVIVTCRASNPMDCFVDRQPRVQAHFQELCRQTPQQCQFRADGTVSLWTGPRMSSKQLDDELRRRAEAARAKLRANGEAN